MGNTISTNDGNEETNDLYNYLKQIKDIENNTIDVLMNKYKFKSKETLVLIEDKDIKTMVDLSLCQRIVVRNAVKLLKPIVSTQVTNTGTECEDKGIPDEEVVKDMNNRKNISNDENNTEMVANNDSMNYWTTDENEIMECQMNRENIRIESETTVGNSNQLMTESVVNNEIQLIETEVNNGVNERSNTDNTNIDSESDLNSDSEYDLTDNSVHHFDDESIDICLTDDERETNELIDSEESDERLESNIEESVVLINTNQRISCDSKTLKKFGIKGSKVVLNDISLDVMPNDSNGKKVQFKCLLNNCNKRFDLRLKMKIHYKSIHKRRVINHNYYLREKREKYNLFERNSLPSSSTSYSNYSNDNYVTNNEELSGKQIFVREKCNAISGKRRSLEFQWKCLPENERNEYKIKAMIRKRTRSFTDNCETYECKACNESFDQYLKYISHMVFGHRKGESLECSICGNHYRCPSSLIDHIRAVHENKKDFQCKQCLKIFKSRDGLRIHSKTLCKP